MAERTSPFLVGYRAEPDRRSSNPNRRPLLWLHCRQRIKLWRSANMISLIIPCWNDRDTAIALARKWADHPLIQEVIIAGVNPESACHVPEISCNCRASAPADARN